MGIIIRKSLITTIFSYLGVVIGYLNILYLFPKFLNPDQIGLYRLVLDSAILLAPFAQSGIMQGILRFYPVYDKQEKTNDFSIFSLLFSLGSISIFSLVLLLLRENILQFLFSGNIEQVREFYTLLIYLIIVISFIAIFEGFERANLRIVLTNFLKDVYIRFLTALSVFLYFQDWLNYYDLLYSLLVIYGSAALILLFSILSKHHFRKGFSFSMSLQEMGEIIRYNFFMVISAGSNLVVGKIDSLMISAYLGLTENGIYTTLFYVAVIIEIPKRAIAQLAISLYAKSFAANRLQEVRSLYAKTSLNQLIIGLLLYIGICVNLHNLFAFIPNGEEFEVGKWVIVIIGASRIIDMAAGANGELIVMSKHYKFNVYLIATLAVLTVVTNILLIPAFGINGAALASLISLLLFNLIKLLFIYRRFGMQPFSLDSLKVLAIAAISFLAGYSFPLLDNHFADLFIRSALVTLVYGGLTLFTAVSADINGFVVRTWNRFLKR